MEAVIWKKNEKSSLDARLIIWGWASLEADFQRYYNLDINTAMGTMSLRRFLVLIRGLGEFSNFAQFLKEKKGKLLAEFNEDNLLD